MEDLSLSWSSQYTHTHTHTYSAEAAKASLVNQKMTMKVYVAVVGIGWWSQGWHLPFLDKCRRGNNGDGGSNDDGANAQDDQVDVELVAIVDSNPHPKSKLNPNLEPLHVLGERYNCQVYSTLDELLDKEGPRLNGVLLATPHATHYELGKQIMMSCPHIHICMEKPLTTDVDDAYKLLEIVNSRRQQQNATTDNRIEIGSFFVNHSANYTVQARQAREAIQSGRIGVVRHVTASFASPLKWIFEEKSHVGWNEPTGKMIGNGFSWGQMCHLIGWIYHAVPTLQPHRVYCDMVHSSATGADIAVTATVRCRQNVNESTQDNVGGGSDGEGDGDGGSNDNFAVMSLSGTTLLPGYEHSEESIGKRIHIEFYGTHGALFYSGIQDQPSSGKLILVDADSKNIVLNDSFEFEQLEYDGHTTPQSLKNWISACQGSSDYYIGADCELGVKTVETVAAMYESDHLEQPVTIPDDRQKQEQMSK